MRTVEEIAAKGYWRADDAAVVVSAWRASGLSRRAFANEIGCDARRLQRWVRLEPDTRKLAPTKSPQQRTAVMRFVELRVAAPEPPALEVVVGEVVVRIRRGFDGQ